MGEDNGFALGYAMGQDNGGRSNNGMFGGGGIYDLLALALVFGAWGGGGFGGFGGFGGGAGIQGAATRADINEGFALNGITNGITAIQQGICDATYGLTSTINGGFNSLSSQLASCCCDNRAAIADLKYNIGSEFCGLGNTIQSGLRDVIDNQNANYRGIMDFMVQSKLDALRSENEALRLRASQADQNAVIRAAIDASTAEIIRRTGNDCPTPAYWVSPPTPVQVPYQGNGCGCGCG